MPQRSSSNVHVWRAGYRAYVSGQPFTDAPRDEPDRSDWLAGYVRARTDRAKANDAAGKDEQ
jgi:hypothetical protein